MAGASLGIALPVPLRALAWPAEVSVRGINELILPLLIVWGCFSGEYPGPVVCVDPTPLLHRANRALHYAVVFWFVTDPGSRWSRIASNPVLRWVGMISYSLYLWQFPFVYVRDADWGWATPVSGRWICTFVPVTASYYFVERPFLRLKERKRTAPPPVPSSRRRVPRQVDGARRNLAKSLNAAASASALPIAITPLKPIAAAQTTGLSRPVATLGIAAAL